MGEFPSGQRGQTVNLLLIASVVRIHLPPPNKHRNFDTKITVLILVYLRKNQVFSIFLCEIQSHCGIEPQRSFLFIGGLSPFSGYKSCDTISQLNSLIIQSLPVILEMTREDSEQMVSHKRSTTFSRVAKTSFRKPRLRISFQICSMGFISGVYGGI